MWNQKLLRLREFSYSLSNYTRLRARVRGKRQTREERGLKPRSLEKFALFYFFPRRAWLWGKKDDHSRSRNSSYPTCFRYGKINKPSEGKRALKNDRLARRVFFLFKSLNWYRFGSSNLKRPPLELSGTFLAEYNETKTGTIVQHFKNLSRQEGFRNVLNANKNKVLAYFFLLEFVPRRGDNE